MTARIYAGGCGAKLRAQLEAALGCPVRGGIPDEPTSSDVVFLDVSHGDGLPLGNAFAACRIVKRARADTMVLLLIRDDDPVSEGIARFCAADACVRLDADRNLCEPDALAALVMRRAAPTVPRLERVASSLDDLVHRDTALLRMLEERRDSGFLDQLNDPETGLFNGQFAAFKLDEEFKRAMRFQQPLSLILLDCGADLPEEPTRRRLVLAEVASLFLTECRDIDTLARFTETIFLFLLPGTGPEGAASVARRMLDGLGDRTLSAPVRFHPAAGVATVPRPGISDRTGLLGHVEACLEVARTDPALAGLCVSSE